MDNYKRLSSNDMRDNMAKKAKQKYQSKKGAFHILKKVFYYSREYRWYLYSALFLDIINTITTTLMPIYIGYSIDCIISKGNVHFDLLYRNIFILLILVVISGLTKFLEQVCLAKYNYKGTFKIRDLLFKKFQNVPISFIDTSSHGDLISRMINDIDIMTDGFLESFASTISGITSIIGTFIAMLVLDIRLSVIIIVLTPLSLFLSFIIVKKAKKYVKKEVDLQGEISGYLEEYIGGERIVKAFNHEEKSIENFQKINTNFNKVSTKSLFYRRNYGPKRGNYKVFKCHLSKRKNSTSINCRHITKN